MFCKQLEDVIVLHEKRKEKELWTWLLEDKIDGLKLTARQFRQFTLNRHYVEPRFAEDSTPTVTALEYNNKLRP
jgi:hypothetical protein